MNILKTKNDLHDQISAWKKEGQKIGFVPTMGALHEGHLSLIDMTHKHADKVVVSIYVNPTQFAPHEDLESYPRTLESDANHLKQKHVHVLYAPNFKEMYPDGIETKIKAGDMAKGLETDFRPHFFDGVVNIVSRLFEHVQPDIAVFGQKDFQQVCVVREMVEHMILNIKIIEAPIIRDTYGLALSSRNAYLSNEDISIARTLNSVLYSTAQQLKNTPEDEANILKKSAQKLLKNGFDKVDYVALWQGRILAAAYVGKTRLIDNIGLDETSTPHD